MKIDVDLLIQYTEKSLEQQEKHINTFFNVLKQTKI